MQRLDRQTGFTLLEIVIVVAVLALLAGVVVPMFGTVSRDARIARVLQTYDELRTATQRHHADTNRLCHEYQGYTDAANHGLSMNWGVSGWKGPYIDHPLNSSDNPYGGFIHLYETLSGVNGWGPGFDLDGDGNVETIDAGQMVGLQNVPAADAAEIDKKLDSGVAGTWESSGRVKFVNGVLLLLVMDVPN